MKADLHLAKLEDLYGIIAGKLDQRGVGWDISASAQAHKKIFKAVGTKLPTRSLCLGLGTLTLSENRATPSIVQLYAFQAMIAAFDIPTTKISMHDPMFTATDKKFLTSFGFSLPETAAAARAELICEESTFVFAPFLPFRVLELIFKQNWEQGYLENVLLCGPELSGWLNDHYVRTALIRDLGTDAYIPRLDRCLPLLNKVVLLPKQEDGDELYADDEQARLEGPSPILVAARQVSGFHFQWIPPYRLYAMGEEFWHVLELKDSRWGPQEDEELEEVGKKKGRESKL